MIDPTIISSVVYASLFGLMALGLTLTYITTKVPNFAYGSFVTVGMYASYASYRLNGLTPYESAPIAFLLGAVSAVAMYLGILRVLARRGSSLVSLMIATIAIDIAFIGIFGIYSDYLSSRYGLDDTKLFYALRVDFTPTFVPLQFLYNLHMPLKVKIVLSGIPGIFVAAPAVLAVVTLVLYLFLTQTKFGVALRASVENPNLAKVLGINVELVYVVAWFLAGGFAALSGSFYDLWLPGGTDAGSKLIVEIFSASVLGGLASIYGAVVGGLIVGATEILVTNGGVILFGDWVLDYQKGVPIAVMIVTLLVMPQGLASIKWRALPARIRHMSFASIRHEIAVVFRRTS